MGVSVVIPVRVRLDPTALAADPGALGTAVEAATGRALAQAREAVFVPRGGYARPLLRRPTITFHGPGIGALDAASRMQVGDSIRVAIARAAESADLDAGADARAGAAEVARPREAARFDPGREGLGGASYVLDSYGSHDRQPDAAVAGKNARPPKPAPAGARMRLARSANSPEDLLAAGDGYLGKTIRALLAGDYAALNHVGVLFLNAEDGREWLTVLKVRLTDAGLVSEGGIIFEQRISNFGLAGSDDPAVRQMSVAGMGRVVTIREQVAGPIATREALVGHVATFFEKEGVLDDLLAHAVSQKAANSKQQKAQQLLKTLGKRGAYEGYAADLVGRFQQHAPYRLFRREVGATLALFEGDFLPSVARLHVVPLLEDAIAEQKARDSATGNVSGGGHVGECRAVCFGYDETAPYTADGIDPEELITGPFECEPAITEFGELGERMAATIEEIAATLHMGGREWRHAGAFAISAARVMRGRSAIALRRAIGDLQGIKPAPHGRGNAGDADVTVSRSPAMNVLRELAGVAPQLAQLNDMVQAALGLSSTFLSDCGRQQFGASWTLHYLDEFTPAVRDAGYAIFVEACRVCMLQLLGASKAGIDWLTQNFDAYFASIEKLVLGAVKRISELRRMRENILQAEAGHFAAVLAAPGQLLTDRAGRRGIGEELKAGGDATLRVGFQAWRDAREWWRDDDKRHTIDRARRELDARAKAEGVIERQPDGSYAVRETRGTETRLWTRTELEAAIALVEGMAGTIEPLVKHMTNLEGSVAAFQGGRQPAYDYVRKIVRRMETANKEAIEKVRDDRMFAFRTAKLSETWTAQTVPGTGVELQNIHAMAHEAVGDAFGGSWIYAEGLKHLFGSELGREAVLPFLELTVTIGAFVLFAPAGYALSAISAAERYETAAGHEALAEGLFDPDAVISRAEAELEMFMSHFEIALLVLPEGGAIARRVFQGGRTLLRQGLRQGSRTVARQAAAHMLEELGVAMKGKLLNAFIHQLVTAKALEPILQLALAPVFAVLADEAGAGALPSDPARLAEAVQFLAEYGDADIRIEASQRIEDAP